MMPVEPVPTRRMPLLSPSELLQRARDLEVLVRREVGPVEVVTRREDTWNSDDPEGRVTTTLRGPGADVVVEIIVDAHYERVAFFDPIAEGLIYIGSATRGWYRSKFNEASFETQLLDLIQKTRFRIRKEAP